MKNLTYIYMILDQSTSMRGIAKSTIDGFNTFITEQQALGGECLFSLRLFDTKTQEVIKNQPISDIALLTSETYNPDGSTALYDAIGFSVFELGQYLASLPEQERPNKVLVAIITDGEENASRTYGSKEISEMIKHQKEVYNWDFMFLGANQDALTVADSMSISKGNSMSFTQNGLGTLGLKKLSDTIGVYRSASKSSDVTRDMLFADAGYDNKVVD